MRDFFNGAHSASVINVLHRWLGSNLDDFLGNPELLTVFREFLSRKMTSDMPGRRQLLQRAFTTEVDRRQNIAVTFTTPPLPPVLPKQCRTLGDLESLLKDEERRNWMLIDTLVRAALVPRLHRVQTH